MSSRCDGWRNEALDRDFGGAFICRTDEQWERVGCEPFDSTRGDAAPDEAARWEAQRV